MYVRAYALCMQAFLVQYSRHTAHALLDLSCVEMLLVFHTRFRFAGAALANVILDLISSQELQQTGLIAYLKVPSPIDQTVGALEVTVGADPRIVEIPHPVRQVHHERQSEHVIQRNHVVS